MSVLRGSVPLLWRQRSTPRVYNPVIEIEPSLTQQRREFRRWRRGEDEAVVLVNLVDKKGGQGRLGTLLGEVASKEGVEVGWFDFHKLARERGYDDALEAITDWMLEREEEGKVMRVNCVDCLDRTNVVQSAYMMRRVERELERGGVKMGREGLKWWRGAWAKNADAIAEFYAGTPALKRDYTRTGRRTAYGKVEDGVNSVRRWGRGCWWDEEKQRAVDDLFGGLAEEEGEEGDAPEEAGEEAGGEGEGEDGKKGKGDALTKAVAFSLLAAVGGVEGMAVGYIAWKAGGLVKTVWGWGTGGRQVES